MQHFTVSVTVTVSAALSLDTDSPVSPPNSLSLSILFSIQHPRWQHLDWAGWLAIVLPASSSSSSSIASSACPVQSVKMRRNICVRGTGHGGWQGWAWHLPGNSAATAKRMTNETFKWRFKQQKPKQNQEKTKAQERKKDIYICIRYEEEKLYSIFGRVAQFRVVLNLTKCRGLLQLAVGPGKMKPKDPVTPSQPVKKVGDENLTLSAGKGCVGVCVGASMIVCVWVCEAGVGSKGYTQIFNLSKRL